MELKFHTPDFEELALQQPEPRAKLETLLKRLDKASKDYKKFLEKKEKAEAPWRRTHTNAKGETVTYIDYDAWEKANPLEALNYGLSEFGGFSGIDMLEEDIDIKIAHMNQRERQNK